MIAAEASGCKYILVRDRFIRRKEKCQVPRHRIIELGDPQGRMPMLQKKPITEWTSYDLRKWRARLGTLIVLAHQAHNKEKAKRIIEEYKEGKLGYIQAKKRLEKLAAQT